MDFSQIDFWFSLLLACPFFVLGCKLCKNRVLFNKIFLFVLSLTLLFMASPETLVIFLTVTLTAYWICKISLPLSETKRKFVLAGLVPLLLLPLLYYKYSYFIGSNLLMQNWESLRHLIIPIGISFYTFQVIGFCIDTLLRNNQIPSFMDYMNFCSFFPQIVAGPIERRDDLLPQISTPRLNFAIADLNQGLRFILLGLFFKMVMADNLAAAFNPSYMGGSAIYLWLNNLLFTFRIYFDFAGYGLTAYGIAKCLGINLRMNFLSPYTASNISDFWRRWHTSLTLWFRDYIYFPLGGSRTKRWALNILIVFSISGLWHGAGWNFIIWGTLSGFAMIIHRIFRKSKYALPRFIGWCITFGLMVFIWMFFYITNWNHLLHSICLLCKINAYGIDRLLTDIYHHSVASAEMACFLALSFVIIFIEYISGKSRNDPYALLLSTPACAIMVFFLLLFDASQESQFIYFAF